MKKVQLPLYFLVAFHFSFGQTNKPESLSSLAKLDLGLQGIGLTYEPRISNKISADLSFGIGGGYDITEESLDYQVIKPALYFSASPKYFYNLNTRINKGKSIQGNSGNFIGARIKYNMPLSNKTDEIRNSFLVNIHWGIQRMISRTWQIAARLGAGYAADVEYNFGTIYPSLDFVFSYVFSEKNK